MKTLLNVVFGKPSLLYSSVFLTLFAFSAVTLSSCMSQGGCARELPRLEPSQAAPGETFRMYGGSGGFGAPCNDNPEANESGSPERNIRIELQQGDKVWLLDTVDALPDYTLDAEFTVPPAAKPGPATLLIHSESAPQPIEVPFQISSQETTIG